MSETVWLREARAYPNGCVATPHYLATEAGAAMLAAGGNALDAALAANLVLTVVNPYMCGPGGDILAMIWDGAVHAYRGVGRSPNALTSKLLQAGGETAMPVFGPHPITVPGAVDGWFTLIERFGSRTFADVATRAIDYAEHGFPVTPRGAWFFSSTAQLFSGAGLTDFEDFYGFVRPGSWVRQPELARTYRMLAEHGSDAYYRGPIGAAVVERIQGAGGVMTIDDLHAHRGEFVDPLHANVSGTTIYEMPPPNQGVTALEALRILDGLNLQTDGPDRWHLLIEAVKLALADRNVHLGDPDAMPIAATELLSDAWIDRRRATIDRDKAAPWPPLVAPDGGTVYLCAADRDGLAVSLIQSNFTAAGSGLRVRDWGINLHNRGSAFRLDDAHPNGVGPRKMPLHTLIPALAVRGDELWLVFGTEGGHGQAQTHAQLMTRMLVDHEDPQAALSAPRFTVDPNSGLVAIEDHCPAPWIADLEARGHPITVVKGYRHGPGLAHMIERMAPGWRAASDPRSEGGTGGH